MNSLEAFIIAYAAALDKKFAQTPEVFAAAVKAAEAAHARQLGLTTTRPGNGAGDRT